MNPVAHLTIEPADKTDAHTIAALAHAIWPGTYGGILSAPQIHYMLNLFYSEAALHRQLEEGHWFFLAAINSEPVGFVSFAHDHTKGAFKIQKLYVHPLVQGKGVGRALLAFVTEEARKKQGRLIRLNVNRRNPARQFYERHGFAVAGEEEIAIGEGYFMTDYVMEKQI